MISTPEVPDFLKYVGQFGGTPEHVHIRARRTKREPLNKHTRSRKERRKRREAKSSRRKNRRK